MKQNIVILSRSRTGSTLLSEKLYTSDVNTLAQEEIGSEIRFSRGKFGKHFKPPSNSGQYSDSVIECINNYLISPSNLPIIFKIFYYHGSWLNLSIFDVINKLPKNILYLHLARRCHLDTFMSRVTAEINQEYSERNTLKSLFKKKLFNPKKIENEESFFVSPFTDSPIDIHNSKLLFEAYKFDYYQTLNFIKKTNAFLKESNLRSVNLIYEDLVVSNFALRSYLEFLLKYKLGWSSTLVKQSTNKRSLKILKKFPALDQLVLKVANENLLFLPL